MSLTLLITFLLCSGSVFTDEVPQPRNLRIKSENLGLVLEWDPPQNAGGNEYRYTAEFRAWLPFNGVCVNVSSLSCDFTSVVTVYGTYTLRVRTELNGRSSDWMKVKCEPLENITVISAPEVRLQSRNGKMEVDISDPVLRKGSLKDVYSHVLYQIRYWSEGTAKMEEQMDQSRVMLTNLLPWTNYCVDVQIVLDYLKKSLPSNITCEMNTASDEVASWQIVVALLGSFLATLFSVLMISLAVWYAYRGIRFLNPRAKLPEHFKQYLSERPSSSILLAMQNNTQPKELYHEFSIIAAQDVPPESKQTERSKPNQLNADLTDPQSEPEGSHSWKAWPCDLPDESQSADAVNEQLLE